MTGATLLFLLYLIKSRPFSLKLDRFLNILASLVLLILYSFCFTFSLLSESSFKRERRLIGYIFIALVLGFFVVTVFLIFISKARLWI